MSDPKRIQRLRTKGSKMPTDAIYVGRPGKWGNPFVVAQEKGDNGYKYSVRGSANHLLGMHRTKAEAQRQAADLFELHTGPMGNYEIDGEALRQLVSALAGKDLACWCKLTDPCHADVLLELANGAAS